MDATRRLKQTQHLESARLRVLLDGRKLFDGGIGVYTRNCISAIISRGHFVGIILTESGLQQARDAELPWLDVVHVHVDNAARYSLDEYFGLAKRIPVHAYDVFHSPHYTVPFGIDIPIVVTIHDIIHITHPEKRVYPHLARLLIRSALKRVAAVITVSNASANHLRHEFGDLVSDKLAVIPNTIATVDSFTNSVDASLSEVPYFFALFSTLKPHKGFDDLLLAYSCYVSQQKEQAMPLVLAGQALKDTAAIQNRIDELGLGRHVRIPGVVTDDELRKLYAKAHAVVIASREEGFCIPVIEAHAAGTPVVARPVAAISELTLVDDTIASDLSLPSFAAAIRKAAFRITDRKALATRFGHQVADRFSPEVTSDRLLRVYQTALGEVL